MSILLKTIQIYPKNSDNPITITDDIDSSVKVSERSKGSYTEITLKNVASKYVENKQFKLGVDDEVKIYVKWATESTDSIDTTASTDLLMSCEITEIKAKGGLKETTWEIKCMDKTAILMSRLWAYSYDINKNMTAPQIIEHILNIATTSGKGIVSDEVGARLVSNGGYIQDTRPDNSAFPATVATKRFKPIYEWVDDLSQPESTNKSDELESTTIPAPRPYFFYIDENNQFHWEYPDTSSSTHYMTFGQTAAVSPDTYNHVIYSFELKQAVFDIINMVIFNAGKDFYGSGILDYFYDSATKSPKLKMVYKAWTDISNGLIEKEIKGTNSAKYTEDNATPGTLTWNSKRYTVDYTGGGFTPHWSSTAVTTDTLLNNSLRTEAVRKGDEKASNITKNLAGARWKGKINVKGYKYIIGELITFNSTQHGILDALVRITDIQHKIMKGNWTTTLSVEEDPEERKNA